MKRERREEREFFFCVCEKFEKLQLFFFLFLSLSSLF